MAANPRTSGRSSRPPRQNKTDVRHQKRKRDQDDITTLEDAIRELVCRLSSTVVAEEVNC